MISQIPEQYNRGVRYLEKLKYDKALTFFRKEPHSFKELHLNMGSCYSYLERDQEALDCFITAADHSVPFASGIYGSYPMALNNIGLIMYSREEDLLSIDYYNAALDIDSNYHTARWHRGLSNLRRYVSGYSTNRELAFIDYDFRFYVSNRPTAIDMTIPRWDGVTGGGSVIVLAEQGLGDNFQWLRYVKVLESIFDKVWVQLPTALHSIHPHLRVVSTVEESDATVSIPLCSLTRYFGIDSAAHDYLPRVIGHDFNFSGLKIGIVAQGSTTHNNNRRRSVSIHQFLKLRGPNVRLYNLTPGSKEVGGIINLNPSSWLETREYLCGLDLIISVDTSVVHLAGVLGIPCWVLMPKADTDWRWGDSTCGDANIWYPTVKVFRNPNCWDTVFKSVKESLSDFSSIS